VSIRSAVIGFVVSLALFAPASYALQESPLLAQRDYRGSATIRGENIWLRVDPAEDTEIHGYLQRGDEVLITDDGVAADGDVFYPVEVVETGESGWVRELAIDPRSVTDIEELPEVVVDEPPPVEVTAEPERRNNRQARTARESVDEQAEVPEVVVDEPPTVEATPEPEESSTGEVPVISESDGVTTITGTGQQVSDPFTLDAGLYRVTASTQSSESHSFFVHLIGPADFEDSLFSEILEAGQSWEGETSVSISESDEYLLEVTAGQDDWTVVIAPDAAGTS
jgi:hypothetical protein